MLMLMLDAHVAAVETQGEEPPAGALSLGGTADASETASPFMERNHHQTLIV
jgi:hypothetical protein